jgi:transposase
MRASRFPGCPINQRLPSTCGVLEARRLSSLAGPLTCFYTQPNICANARNPVLDRPDRLALPHHREARWWRNGCRLQGGGHGLVFVRRRTVRNGNGTDGLSRRDACHILDLLLTDRFPRIWVPSPAERDLRQMLRHRHKLVRIRTSVKNQLHALAMGQGLCRRKKLWARVGRQELENLVLDPWSSRRRADLLQLLDQLDPWIAELDQAVIQEAERRPQAAGLMKQAGVGPVTALAFVLTIGPVSRFPSSKNLVSYLGLNPSEASSGGRQRLGAISKQGNSMMRYLLIEAAQTASRLDPEWRRDYQRLKFRRGGAVAKVAIARKLAVRLYRKLPKQRSQFRQLACRVARQLLW